MTILSLRENKIRELPCGVGELINLLTFDVSHNHLEHLPEGSCSLVVLRRMSGIVSHQQNAEGVYSLALWQAERGPVGNLCENCICLKIFIQKCKICS